MIVHAGAQHAEPVAVGGAGDAEGAVGEIDVEIFDFRAPVRGETEFGADAGGPARIGMGFRKTERLATQLAEGQTAGAVEQDVAESIAGTAPHGAEPGVRELPGRKRILSPARLDVAFNAEHPWTG